MAKPAILNFNLIVLYQFYRHDSLRYTLTKRFWRNEKDGDDLRRRHEPERNDGVRFILGARLRFSN